MSDLALRYLALGDSYTIGTGASHPSVNFPSLLARKLEAITGRRVDVRNPAVNGFTTRDLIRLELPELERFNPDLVSVLIGVNDLLDGDGQDEYRERLVRIYDAIDRRVATHGIAAISIPDFSVAPAAARFGAPAALAQRVEAFNRVAADEARAHGFRYLDLASVSRSGARRTGWFADDELHPGDIQYAAWADWLWQQLMADWCSLAKRGYAAQ